MKTITSSQNALIKHAVKLYKSAHRKEHQEFIAQHHDVCKTLTNNGYTLKTLFITQDATNRYKQDFDEEKIIIVTNEIMKKISNSVTPSGIVGIFKIPSVRWTPTEQAIVLYDLQDPGNLGTLIRTAAAMNIKNIFTINGVDAYNSKVIQASAGTMAYINIIPITWQDFLIKHTSYPICALVVRNGQTPEQLHISQSILVIGNEGAGLPELVIQACNQALTIPMPGNTESLNAAVAGSIALYIKTKRNFS